MIKSILEELNLNYTVSNDTYTVGNKAFVMWNLMAQDSTNRYQVLQKSIKSGIQLFQLTSDLDYCKVLNFIKSKLLLHTDKIYARKCTSRWIEPSEYVNILEKYHIQGSTISHHRIGIFFGEELVGAMGFVSSTFGWTLNRLVFSDKNIIGGAGKMLSFFKAYSDLPIETFSNNAYSDGGIYSTLGFVKVKTNTSDMWYVSKEGKLLNRRRFQKKSLPGILTDYDDALTESQNMINNGYGVYVGPGTCRWEISGVSDKKYYIYCISCKVNGKKYIGKTHQPETRFKQHISASRDPKCHTYLHRAIRKHSAENFTFEIITETSKENSGSEEMRYIEEFDCCFLDGDSKGYNMTRGGDGSDSESTSFYAQIRTQNGMNPFSKQNGGSELSKKVNSRRLVDGSHNFLQDDHKAKVSSTQKKLIEGGSHLFSGDDYGDRSSALQKKRILNGTHHILSEEFRAKSSKKALEMAANGTSNFTKSLTCPVCGFVGKGSVMTRWHFDKCGKTKETWNDGIKNYTVYEGSLPEPHWIKGMRPRNKNN